MLETLVTLVALGAGDAPVRGEAREAVERARSLTVAAARTSEGRQAVLPADALRASDGATERCEREACASRPVSEGGGPRTGDVVSVPTQAGPTTAPLAPPVGGPPGAPLSLGEVLAAADAAFPSLVATRADVDAADGERLTAAGGFDPTWKTKATGVPVSGYPQARVDSVIEAPTPLWGASFFAGYRWGAGTFQDYYAGRETWTGGEVRAGASVPLLRNGPIDKRRAALAKAELQQRLAGLSLEQARLEVARLAAVRYWDWVAAGRKREVARALLKLAKDRDAQLSSRATAGDVAVFDRQDNLRALVQREGLLVQAQRAVENAAFELSLYLRDAHGEPVLPDDSRMPPGLPEPEPSLLDQADVDAALARRPDVQRLLTKKQQLEVELRLQKNQLLPGLDVGIAVSRDLGVSPRPEAAKLGLTEVEVNAMLDVPLLYRAPLGRIQSAQAEVSKVDAQLRLARDRVAVEVRDARSALAAALERARLARREVEVAEQLERGERTRFSLGDSTQLFVNLREQTTAEARLREVDALADFQKAVAALRLALGELQLK
jgi:outer membrane protein TolC